MAIGVTLTGTGMVDGKLHIQCKYDELAECEIWGEFWTCNNAPIQGEWQVTFAISE